MKEVENYLKKLKKRIKQESDKMQKAKLEDYDHNRKKVNDRISNIVRMAGAEYSDENVNFYKEYAEIKSRLTKRVGEFHVPQTGEVIKQPIYDRQVLSAVAQSSLYSSKSHAEWTGVHYRYKNIPGYLGSDLVTVQEGQSTYFNNIKSGQYLRINYSPNIQRHLAQILEWNKDQIMREMGLNEGLASHAIGKTLEQSLIKDPKFQERFRVATSPEPMVWAGSQKASETRTKNVLTLEHFNELYTKQNLAEYVVFNFEGSDIGHNYQLAQQYAKMFGLFSPLVVATRVHALSHMYYKNPSVFQQSHLSTGEPVLKFDVGATTTSQEIFHSYLGDPMTELLSPIPSGMFIQHADMYGMKETLKTYGQIRTNNLGQRFFDNNHYNFVRRRLFRGYDYRI